MNRIDGVPVRIRVVDAGSEHYHGVGEYMIRSERRRLDGPEMRAKPAAAAPMTPAAFVNAFGAMVIAPEGWSP